VDFRLYNSTMEQWPCLRANSSCKDFMSCKTQTSLPSLKPFLDVLNDAKFDSQESAPRPKVSWPNTSSTEPLSFHRRLYDACSQNSTLDEVSPVWVPKLQEPSLRAGADIQSADSPVANHNHRNEFSSAKSLETTTRGSSLGVERKNQSGLGWELLDIKVRLPTLWHLQKCYQSNFSSRLPFELIIKSSTPIEQVCHNLQKWAALPCNMSGKPNELYWKHRVSFRRSVPWFPTSPRVGNSGLKAFKVDLGCMTYNIERSSVVIMSKIYHRIDEGRGPVDLWRPVR
jgi:hypothetical protein